jgi:type VI secretion system protein VasD
MRDEELVMNVRRHRFVMVVAGVAACLAAACGKKAPEAPPPAPALTIAAAADARVKAPMTIAASADVNPNDAGRPSPVIVRVYQLRADAAFTNADFFALWDDDQKVLGQELISRDQFDLDPSEKQVIDVTVSGDTRFVAAVAAFRDIRNAQWRAAVAAVPNKAMTVAVERTRVVVSVAP